MHGLVPESGSDRRRIPVSPTLGASLSDPRCLGIPEGTKGSGFDCKGRIPEFLEIHTASNGESPKDPWNEESKRCTAG